MFKNRIAAFAIAFVVLASLAGSVVAQGDVALGLIIRI